MTRNGHGVMAHGIFKVFDGGARRLIKGGFRNLAEAERYVREHYRIVSFDLDPELPGDAADFSANGGNYAIERQ